MTVDEWVYEAVEAYGPKGATLRQVQRSIDEKHFEELAVDTIEASLLSLLQQARLTQTEDRFVAQRRTSKEDALRKLFGDA